MVLLQVLINGLFLGGVYALISLGLTLIFGVVRVINFAHGEILMISMYASYFCFSLLGLNPYLSLILVIPAMFLFGMLIDQIIIRPIRNALPTCRYSPRWGFRWRWSIWPWSFSAATTKA